jgi:hypothetical protein
MATDETGVDVDDDRNGGDDKATEGNDNDHDNIDYWKNRARQNERQAKANADAAQRATEAEKRLQEIENESKSDRERELDKARHEAADEARKDAITKANGRIVKSEIRVAAAGKLADPEDAVRLLNVDDFAVTDDGDVDTAALGKAVERLLKDKPYLAVYADKRKHGDGDQGVRGRAGNGSSSMNDLIRQKAGRS